MSKTGDLLSVLKLSLETLDNVRGNINPERGYADELESEILVTIGLLLAALESQQTASVGGEREAFEAFDYANRCFRLRREGERYVYATTERELLAFRAGAEWQARAALSPAGGGVVPDAAG